MGNNFNIGLDFCVGEDDEGVLGDDGRVDDSIVVNGEFCVISLAKVGNTDSSGSFSYKFGHDFILLKEGNDGCGDADNSDVVFTFSVKVDICFNLDFDMSEDLIEEPIPDDDGFRSSNSFGIMSPAEGNIE